MTQPISKREFYTGMVSVLLVTCVFGYATYTSYVSPPINEVVLYDVFEVDYPANDRVQLTTIYSRGQGTYIFYGYHPEIKTGGSYHIKYTSPPDSNRWLTLIYVKEVHLPG